MVIIVTENVKEGLRGELTRWMLEIKAGIFIGNMSAMVRDKLWKEVKASVNSGSALMLYSAQTEQGYCIEMHNEPRRKVIDVEGISLMAYSSQT